MTPHERYCHVDSMVATGNIGGIVRFVAESLHLEDLDQLHCYRGAELILGMCEKVGETGDINRVINFSYFPTPKKLDGYTGQIIPVSLLALADWFADLAANDCNDKTACMPEGEFVAAMHVGWEVFSVLECSL